AMEQRPSGGPREPTEDDQAADVRSSGFRPAEGASAQGYMTTRGGYCCCRDLRGPRSSNVRENPSYALSSRGRNAKRERSDLPVRSKSALLAPHRSMGRKGAGTHS